MRGLGFGMEGDDGNGRPIGGGIVFLKYFGDLADPSQAGKVVCPLDEILLLCLLAVLAGA